MILCAGESLIDMLPRRTDAGESAFAPYPGGAVFNTAIALGRLGAPVGFFSGISTDLFGQMLTGALEASGVDAGFAARSERPTTLAFVTLRDGHASYAFYDENTAGRMLAETELPDLSGDVKALFVGGISLMVEPCARAYEALMAREAGQRLTMIDPNIRPGFIRDEAVYRSRIARMMALADIVKLSDEDLAWLAGHDDTDKAASEVLAEGTRLVCITRGSEGVTGYTSSGAVRVAARRVEVVDTVGAGDTFNAGLLAGLREADALTKSTVADLGEDTIRSALELGVRAAAVTVSRAGANPPRRDEL